MWADRVKGESFKELAPCDVDKGWCGSLYVLLGRSTRFRIAGGAPCATLQTVARFRSLSLNKLDPGAIVWNSFEEFLLPCCSYTLGPHERPLTIDVLHRRATGNVAIRAQVWLMDPELA
ncbi:hypothetical protein KC19_8G127700 [Ceratodon purpureus]|uniref:Uncharacterized protein n=1 Tax=Ceratodon purpureus TaxID=3225 RepID=A0A8T0H2S9_CERPU|nr:hypothetical protein KC19_8G127700 [Ceratodon purpureus]